MSCNRHLREIGHKIGEQYLFGENWQKGYEQGCASQAEHVAKIVTGRHKNILQGI